jgi:hypothetical protein
MSFRENVTWKSGGAPVNSLIVMKNSLLLQR